MTRSYLRRTVLSTLAAAGVAGAASATDDEQTQSQNTTVRQEQSVSVGQSQKVVISSEKEEYKPSHSKCAECVSDDGEQQKIGTFLIYNRSTCQRKVTVEVTGRIAQEGNELRAQTVSLQVPPKGRCIGGFTGSMVRVDAEHGDLDMSFKQRSEHEANHCDGEHRVFRDE